MTKVQRPRDMSQLDYLWLYFGGYKVKNEQSEEPSDSVLLTEKSINEIVQGISNGYISQIQYREHPTDNSLSQIVGLSNTGEEVSIVDVPKEIHVKDFKIKEITQEDIDKGVEGVSIGTKVISLTLTNNEEFIVPMYSVSGGDTTSIQTRVVDGQIMSTLKIDSQNNSMSPIKIQEGENGIYGSILLSQKQDSIQITQESDGSLSGNIIWNDI